MSLDINKIKDYLDSKNSYEIFDINYTKKERDCINNFIINKYGNYMSYNTIDNLGNFIKNIGDNNSEQVEIMTNIIKKILDNVLSGYKTDSYYIVIRIQGDNKFFDIPRWHCDGFYYENRNKLQTKFISVLKGNTTLLLNTTKEEREHFYKLQPYKDKFVLDENEFDMKNRKHIIDNIKGTKINITNNQGIIFVAGDRDKCLIHSEPKMDGNRMFLSILPGSKEDMTYLENKIKTIEKA